MDYSELTNEALERRVSTGDTEAAAELDRRAANVPPAPKPDFEATAMPPAPGQKAQSPAVPDGMVAVRDAYSCTCGHPASDIRLDTNTHDMVYPHKCHVDNCKCEAFENAGPFLRPSDTVSSAPVTVGRFNR